MNYRNRTVTIQLLLLPALLAGCGDEVAEDECVTSEQCREAEHEPGLLCVEGTCVECSGDSMCVNDEVYGGGAICDGGECIPCVAGEVGCRCLDGDLCLEGPGCQDGLCAPCEVGIELCPCDELGLCTDGLVCEDGVCVENDCEPGTLECSCLDGECGEELICRDGVCRACPSDVEGCPCDAENACGGGLVCNTDTHLCEQEPEPIPTCEPDAEASILADCQSQHRQCVATATWAYCGDCLTGYLEENDACRPLLTCGDLNCAADFRVCTAGTETSDARCGSCLDGYLEEGRQCWLANCSEDDPGSILETCAASFRECVVAATGEPAQCGGCLAGYKGSSTGTCVPTCATLACEAQYRECVDGDVPACSGCLGGFEEDDDGFCGSTTSCTTSDECPEGTFCVVSSLAAAPRCEPPRCGMAAIGEPGQAMDPTTGICYPCSPCTNLDDSIPEGLTGRIWPLTTEAGDCVCETLDDYFFDATIGGDYGAAPCDADRDGWVRRTAESYLRPDLSDLALRDNARCTLRTIDRVVLRNEFGQELAIRISHPDLGLNTATVALYEPRATDDQAQALELQAPYGDNSLNAAELNPFTRFCVDRLADYNDNGISDLTEHDLAKNTTGHGWMQPFTEFSYFGEIYHGWYADPDDGVGPGAWIIEEVTRCGDDFPLEYSADASPYWRTCTRRRSSSFNDEDHIGLEFARWSCGWDDASSQPDPEVYPNGTCPRHRKGDNSRPFVTLPTPLDEDPPAHGVCDPGLDPSVDDGTWRGMGHHSQFACVEIVRDDAATGPEQLEIYDLVANYQPNACGVQRCTEGEPDCVDSVRLGPESSDPLADRNAYAPQIDCQALPPSSEMLGQVLWVASEFVKYDVPSEYVRGCIDEGAEWPELCPGQSENPFGSIADGVLDSFGSLICGCGYNYGGVSCNVGCPEEYVHYGGDCTEEDATNGYCPIAVNEYGTGGGRHGYWLCGETSGSTPQWAIPKTCTTSDDCLPGQACVDDTCEALYTFRGGVQMSSVERTLLAVGTGAPCVDDSECTESNERCMGGFCYQAEAIGGACDDTTPCPYGSFCASGACYRATSFTLH
ncbi:MAG: hypothetical protein JW797_14050 [Bradymonadales bacterium]|nr:hypothetical protein [Bradymonadales bacterium]